jgi:hypothetical protein
MLNIPNDTNKVISYVYASESRAGKGNKQLIVVTDIVLRHTFFSVTHNNKANNYGNIEFAVQAFNSIKL